MNRVALLLFLGATLTNGVKIDMVQQAQTESHHKAALSKNNTSLLQIQEGTSRHKHSHKDKKVEVPKKEEASSAAAYSEKEAKIDVSDFEISDKKQNAQSLS
jgi:hypothetical protein